MNTLKFGNGEWYGKKDTILAYNDENSNFKPLPFSFDRASSATRVNKDGLIETVGSGEPRIDYKDDSKGALKREPSRSNSIDYSEDVISWSAQNSITRSNNTDISPDGTLSACTIIGTNNATFNSIRQTFSVSTNSTNTFSMFIKKVETETNYLGVGMVYTGGTTDVAYVSFDSVNGIARSIDARIVAETNVIDFGDYWRLEVTSTDDQSNTNLTLDVYATISTDGFNVATGASSLRTIWGMQLELNSDYATSYIPTQGSIVTRVVDFAEQDLPNDNILIDNNSTIYFEVDTTDLINNIPNTGGFLFKNSGGSSVMNFNYGYGRIYSNYYTGSTTAILTSAEVGATYKFAFPLTSGSYLYINGVQKSATSRDWSAISISEIEILFGHSIKDFRIYNEILSDQELINLTTI